MAKFGKFVREESLPITEQELSAFKNHIKGLIMNNPMNITFDIHSNKSIDNSFVIHCKCDRITKRNNQKDRIDFHGISFVIRKQKGYLDITDWSKSKVFLKDFINAPDFQYSVTMVCNGREIPYRCRNRYRMQVKESYSFDTEIPELNFEVALSQLFTQKLR